MHLESYFLRCLVGPTFTFSTTVSLGFFSASFMGMKRPVSALLAFSTVLDILPVFPAFSGVLCEGLPKAFGFDIGLGYPFVFLIANFVPIKNDALNVDIST